MKKQNFKLIKTIFILIISFVIFTASSYAWLANNSGYILNVGGKSITGYFAGGDGSQASPFKISNETHLYNLSWLQNKGALEDKQYYFELTQDIELAGKLNGSDTTTGAVPPIGTTKFPFCGVFDGKNKVIKNLWVSSFKDDWKEQPSNLSQDYSVGNYIGFFGKVAQKTEKTPVQVPAIKNLVLENLEVTTHIQSTETVKSTVGLIAGYADGNLSQIGVKNGIITARENNLTIKSQTSLIGEVGGNVEWEGSPIGIGNKLLIDPNLPGFPDTSTTTPYVPIPNSTPGTAYLVGSEISNVTISPTIRKYQIYANNTDKIVIDNWLSKPITDVNTSSSLKTCTETNTQAQLWEMVKNNGFNKYLKLGNTQPFSSNLVDVENVGGVPQNVVWFQPKNAGTCTFAVCVTNSSNAPVISIYSFTRTNGVIDTESIRELIVTPGSKNQTAYIANFDIPQSAIDEQREFIIGKPSKNTSSSVAGFLYLILPGTGNSGDEGTQPTTLQKIDYACKTTQNNVDIYDIFDTNYTQKRVLLTFDGSYSGSLRFNTSDVITNKVYYYDNTMIPYYIKDSVSQAYTVGSRQNSLDYFDERLLTNNQTT